MCGHVSEFPSPRARMLFHGTHIARGLSFAPVSWTLGSLLLLALFYGQGCASIRSSPCLQFLWRWSHEGSCGAVDASIFNFLRTSLLFSTEAAPLAATRTSGARGFQLLHVLADTYTQLFSFFPMAAVLTGVRWLAVLVMISDPAHFFMCLVAICVSALGKCLFTFLALF